ncbi:hypothetical protein M9980_02505 [Sphingomonas donggukensis]|uniref:Uncharacterized protein n=1 Tax=Sphingomonas donggukensis TaxID=2949093 RepID=A0ABY4TX78_9SPHN|nr:hypothetical protein [Sphingomonas donggukensis]URW76122.1 hypothetical protein M9980_02505 [Sphingomonas donggukensis]
MTGLLAYPVALLAALPTTLCVLGLWVLHSRVVDGNSVDSVFLSFVFLFVTLIFCVSIVANLAAVAIGQVASLAAPRLGGWATIGAAGVLVCALCAWTQRGSGRLFAGPAPVSALPVALFALADMMILAGGLSLLPHPLTF